MLGGVSRRLYVHGIIRPFLEVGIIMAKVSFVFMQGRDVFFPGETIQGSVKVVNGSSRALQFNRKIHLFAQRTPLIVTTSSGWWLLYPVVVQWTPLIVATETGLKWPQ